MELWYEILLDWDFMIETLSVSTNNLKQLVVISFVCKTKSNNNTKWQY